ncbi:PREDICTED: DNA-directed RNA polymerase I subunit RPA43 [Polistes dominula]|uniref:DNA-directed RNA polymerase I subunit RPA43 n=1 Tax=Polistes dominula TaxID=743375 RepID=A0ABM1J7I0_POLDO|nr:PREDICTED: DNA-directed RNA polymerase I subunit RPA43 [Polistes dominula]
MKFNPYTGVTWSLLELEGLLEDENSQVHYERMKKHLALHPFHLNDLSKALHEILSSGLNTYDNELKGFLLAYKNPKLLTTLGGVFYDSYFIHIDIEADFYVFRPQVGNLLKGIVHKKGANYIGVLMHKTFNVSIFRPENGEKWPGDVVNIGQEVKFEVTYLDINSRLPFIRGTFNQTDYLQGCKLPLHRITNGSFYEANESDDTDSSNAVKQQSRNKKKKKSKETNEDVFSEEQLVTKVKRSFSNDDTRNEDSSKHSKKKLKTLEESTNETEKEYEHSDISHHEGNYLNDDETSIKKKKKRDKSLKSKSSELSDITDSEFDFSNVKVKVEKNVSNSESESNVHVKKSKKHSKKAKDSTDENLNGNNVYSETQELESERYSNNEFTTPIKSEKLSKSNNIKEESPNHRQKSSNKRIKKSSTDSESEFGNNVTIKIEKSNKSENSQESNKEVNDSQIELEETQIKTEKRKIKNEFIHEDVKYLFSHEPTISKARKKRSKNEVNNEEDVKPFKKSKLDDSISDESNIYSTPKKRSKKSDETTNTGFLPNNVRIKVERSSSVES